MWGIDVNDMLLLRSIISPSSLRPLSVISLESHGSRFADPQDFGAVALDPALGFGTLIRADVGGATVPVLLGRRHGRVAV